MGFLPLLPSILQRRGSNLLHKVYVCQHERRRMERDDDIMTFFRHLFFAGTCVENCLERFHSNLRYLRRGITRFMYHIFGGGSHIFVGRCEKEPGAEATEPLPLHDR